MILYNDCKKYRTIVPAFLFPNDFREEAVDEDLGNSFCVLIPKEFQSIGYFLYEEIFAKRRNIHVYIFFNIYFVMHCASRKQDMMMTLLFLN